MFNAVFFINTVITQPLLVSLWNDLSDTVFDGVGLAGFKSRANAFLLAWSALSFFVSYCFIFFFLPWVGCVGLGSLDSLSPSLAQWTPINNNNNCFIVIFLYSGGSYARTIARPLWFYILCLFLFHIFCLFYYLSFSCLILLACSLSFLLFSCTWVWDDTHGLVPFFIVILRNP